MRVHVTSTAEIEKEVNPANSLFAPPVTCVGLSLRTPPKMGMAMVRIATAIPTCKKAGDIFADLSAREAEFCLDLHGNNGPGRIAVNQSALVETLIQLSDFRQYDKAESLLSACTREQLEQLHAISDRAFSKRLTYSLEKQLKRSNNGTNKVKGLILVKLMKILNAWCMEGHRPAIRCVLAAMKGQELLVLASLSDLDREVYSMLREFEPLYESTPCDCLH
jgi:hypothetical protein